MTSHLLPQSSRGRGTYRPLDDELDYSSPRGTSPGPEINYEEKGAVATAGADNFDRPLLTNERGKHLLKPSPFSRRAQFLRLLKFPILLRWAVSLLLCVLIAGHLKICQKVDLEFDKWQGQLLFNTTLIALLILLAANLKGAACDAFDMAKWRLLSRRGLATDEIGAILGASRGVIAATRAAWLELKKRQSFLSLTMLGWTISMLGAMLIVSTSGFMYSFSTGTTQGSGEGRGQRGAFGNVNIADNWISSQKPSQDVEYFNAHLYGDISLALIDGNSQAALWGNKPVLEHVADSEQSWTYNFRDWNDQHTYSAVSECAVRITSKCTHYPIVEGQSGRSDSITYQNGSSRSVLYNLQKFSPGATVWVNARADVSPWSFCGPRCARVFALQYLNAGEDEGSKPGAMFDCEITVSAVMSGSQAQDNLADNVAATFAGSIGLRGFVAENDKWQYTRYSREMFWGEDMGNNVTAAAYKAGRFAAGAIAVADALGGKKEATGKIPSAPDGIILVVHWFRVFIILPGLLVLHLAMSIIALSYANSVVLPYSVSVGNKF